MVGPEVSLPPTAQATAPASAGAQAAVPEIDLALTVKMQVEEQELVVEYEVQNQSRRDAYLLNRLYRTSPEFKIDPNIIYVHFDPSTKAAHLLKKVPDLPQGKYVTAPFAPFVTPVRAGEKYSETVRLPLPLKEYRQYSSAPPGTPLRELDCESVDLTVGYYWREPGTTEEVKEIAGTEIVTPRLPPGVRPTFGELKCKPQMIRLKAQVQSAARGK